MKAEKISSYVYESGEQNNSHDYILPCVLRLLDSVQIGVGKRLFEVGCGNGSVASAVTSHGWSVTGVDPSDQGIQHAHAQYPEINLHHTTLWLTNMVVTLWY